MAIPGMENFPTGSAMSACSFTQPLLMVLMNVQIA